MTSGPMAIAVGRGSVSASALRTIDRIASSCPGGMPVRSIARAESATNTESATTQVHTAKHRLRVDAACTADDRSSVMVGR